MALSYRKPKVGAEMQGLKECMDALEHGMYLTWFTRKRSPQMRAFRVLRETRQLVWIKSERSERHILNLHEVREIRRGQRSKDFDRCPKEANDHKSEISFVLYYGSEFRLKTFSVVAKNMKEFQIWIRGLEYMTLDAREASYPVLLERWLRQEFYKLENRNHLVPQREIKPWLQKIGYKSAQKSKDMFQGVEMMNGDLSVDNFCKVYRNVVHQGELYEDCFTTLLPADVIGLSDFQNFIEQEQREIIAVNRLAVSEIMNSYLETNNPDPVFTVQQFMDFLFSKHNLLSTLKKEVTHDMTRPLSHYWISSSHNTYLTGDQITSESSCEAYIRVLRQGCKCIELDCWDGDPRTNEPIIYHGRTLTTKILFKDVLKVISDHAWDISDYPLILSLENHCCLEQQKKMAHYFKSILGDNLLRAPVLDPSKTDQLPSPDALRRKIILKHKKLPNGGGDGFVNLGDDVASDDLSLTRLNGLLYLQDPVDGTWNPHFFVLSPTKLMFSEETETLSDEAEDEDEIPAQARWFHNNISREETIRLFQELGPKFGNGAFIVRPSQSASTSRYSLSFWRGSKVNHCKILTEDVQGQTKYYLVPTNYFDNIQELVQYYQNHALHGHDFHQVLSKPIPKSGWTIDEYYTDNQSREEANDLLMRIPYDGAFLIRKRTAEANSYAIGFRSEGQVRHCRFSYEEGVFTIGNEQFESLEDLVAYYRIRPLFRKMKLRYPTNRDLVARIGQDKNDDQIYCGEYYFQPNMYTSDVQVVAEYPYTARSDTQLNISQRDIIYNVNKSHASWWRGDLGKQRQLWFPASYVKELEVPTEASLGSMENGSIPISNCSVVYVCDDKRAKPHGFRVTTQVGKSLEVACGSLEEAKKWEKTIRETVTQRTTTSVSQRQLRDLAKRERLAIELSDLIVYCQTVDFEPNKSGPPQEMSSLVESKAEKWSSKSKGSIMSKYNIRQFSRIYPKGMRIDSSNYDPTPMWVAGCQMVALNFQTPDAPLQLNHGRFADNGGCGYVLKPDFMCIEDYDPYKADSVPGIPPLSISLTVLGARHLPKRGRSIPSPQVEIEVSGCAYDTKHSKATTSSKAANGLNPVWKESWVFDVCNPELALIRFIVQDVDVFGDPYFLGQATFPVKSMRHGYRSVQLMTGFGEEIHLASLLVYVELGNPEEDYEDVYNSIKNIRENQDELKQHIEELRLQGEVSRALSLETDLNKCQRDLEQKERERKRRIQQKKKKR